MHILLEWKGMMMKFKAGTVCLFTVLFCSLLSAQSTIQETIKSFTTYPFSDPDPVPILLRKPAIYPYFSYNGFSAEGAPRKWTEVALENPYIRLSVMPEVGGKVWGAVEKSTGHEFLYYNNTVKFRQIAMDLASMHYANERFPECLAILDTLTVLPYEGGWEAHHLYMSANIKQAIVEMSEENYDKALSFLEASKAYPEHLGRGRPYDTDFTTQDYLASICQNRLNGSKPTELKPRITIRTELGDILVECDLLNAPVTTFNFLKYVDAGAFRDAGFYRTVTADNQPDNDVKIAVIQGGLYNWDEERLFPPIEHETTDRTGLLHKDGTISMARSAPGTASSEFFICVGDMPGLDFGGARNPDGQGFAAFGQVVDGMDVVRKIHGQPADGQWLKPQIRILDIVRPE